MNCDFFYEVEKKYNLFEKEYNGFEFWIYMRRTLGWKLQKQIDSIGEAHYTKKNNRFENYSHLLRQLKYVFKNGRIPHKKCDAMFVAHPRRVYNGEKYECIYTDILAEQVNNSITIEKSYQGIHYEPAKSEKIIYMDIVDLKIQLYSIYKSLFCKKEIKRLKDFFKTQITDAIEDLNQYYKTDISVENITSELVYLYYTYLVMRKYFAKLLKKTQPRVIVEVVSYSMECQVINEIAYESGIPTVELQHGVITKDHISYNVSKEGDVRQFPQNIFLFADFWKEGVHYPISQEHIIATGYPHLDIQEKRYRNRLERNDEKIKILFLSSGPIGPILGKIAVELLELLSKSDYEIIYKLHPGEYSGWEERYPQLVNSGIRVVSDNKMELYQLFGESDILVSGLSSTTIFEGIYFGLKTYVLDYCLIDVIRNLEKKDLLSVFYSAEDLCEMIKLNQKTTQFTGCDLWAKDALNNVMRELKKIMEK